MSIAVSLMGLTTAFAAGLVSFVSPCVLPLVPGYLSYVSGQRLEDVLHPEPAAGRRALMLQSVFFVLGFSTVFITLGASASAVGRLLTRWRYEEAIAGGVLITLFGLSLAGSLPVPWLHRELRWHGALRGGRRFTAYVLGLAFAFGWTPCIGPVLGAILTMSAMPSGVGGGVVLLSAYALGLGVPFLLTAAFAGAIVPRLRGAGRFGAMVQRVAGWLLVVLGVAMATGYLGTFATWLLDAFPALGRIG